jgi:hypothetical protein
MGIASTSKIVKNGLELKKLWPPKERGSRTQKNKPLNTTKPIPNCPKSSLYVAIKVQR